MDNFSKFLNNNEVLKAVALSKSSNYSLYFILLLILAAFFVLIPFIKAGRQGFWFWLVLIFYLFYLFMRQLTSKNRYYLLTNKRIIDIKPINKENFSVRGSIKLANIQKAEKNRNKNICLTINNKKYYLINIENRDKFLAKISNELT